MTAGMPEEVKTYCRELIEVAGGDGGYVLTTGCGVDHAKAGKEF
jgi:uroporphyrinogen-III decarboxylase